jgi:hypothetical protein
MLADEHGTYADAFVEEIIRSKRMRISMDSTWIHQKLASPPKA